MGKQAQFYLYSLNNFQESDLFKTYMLTETFFFISLRVAENESFNKMSFHNLATVFGPTLLRPSEKDSKIPANPTQPISMSDSWSLEVMSQVTHVHYILEY